MVYKSLIADVPMFNQTVSSAKESRNDVGKIDEILGPTGAFYFTVTPAAGINPADFKVGSKVYLDKAFTLPIHIFTNPQKPSGPKRIGGGVAGRKPPQGNFNRGPPRQGGNNFNRGGGQFQPRTFGQRPNQGGFQNRPFNQNRN